MKLISLVGGSDLSGWPWIRGRWPDQRRELAFEPPALAEPGRGQPD